MVNKLYYTGVIQQKKLKDIYCIIPELEEPIKVSTKFLNRCLSGDKVLIKVKDKKWGFVQKLIERPDRVLIGKIQIINNLAFIKPWTSDFFKDFFVDIKNIGDAKDGDVVEFKIVEWTKKQKSPKATVIKPLYNTSQKQYLLHRLNLPNKFPEEVIEELKDMTITDSDIKNRIDLRNIDIFSIDPDTSTDIDDALSYEKTNFGYRIGIHIADVSHFIKAGTALDKEAYKRSFTIYFPNFNIPMIPHKLSNDLCSLLEGVDRLAVSIIINIDNNMNIINTNIFRSVINNKKKFSYEEAEEHRKNPDSSYFSTMNDLFMIGAKIRRRMFPNEIILNRKEIKWDVDENENPLKMKIKKRISSMDLIQSWMLISNRLVTEKVESIIKNSPWIYRIHNELDDESIAIFKKEMKQIKLEWDDSLTSIENIKKLLVSEKSQLISDILIKKFKPAKYSPKKNGHFSLGVDDYTHFTSPIRRYPDIIIHRILLNILNEKPVYCADIFKDCDWISEQEKKVQKVEKYYNSLMNLKFVKNIKYPLKGEIIQMSNRGILVKTELNIDGIIPYKELKNYMWFDEENIKWIHKSGDFKLGDYINIKISFLDWEKNEIELNFI
jgi:VacB/RNase II family 3'-5' exoribonuclease